MMAVIDSQVRSRYVSILRVLAALLALGALALAQAGFTEAAGTQYYVDSAAGSDSNSGTSASSPWKSLAPVRSRSFAAGDTINLKAGSSFSGGLTFKSSGTASAPITIQAYGSGNKPSISNSASLADSIRLDANYVVVKGLLLKDAQYSGVRVSDGFHHNTIEGNEMVGVGIGVMLQGDNNRVVSNYIHDLKMVKNTSNKSTDDYGANGVMLDNANGNEIAGNRFVNNRAPSIDYGYDGGAIELWGNISDLNVHDNFSSGAQGFLEQGGGDVKNIRVASNESRDYAGFLMLHLDQNHVHGGTASNFVAEGNTIVRNLAKGYRVLDIQGSPGPSQLVFRNNLVYSNTNIFKTGSFGHTGNKYFLVDGASLGASLGSGETSQSGSGISPDGLRYETYFASGGPSRLAALDGGPQFVLGFATLAGLLNGGAGNPLENERHNPENGDGLQQTTTGLMVWRKADNHTAFTNGAITWVNGPYGVQVRTNDQRFPWEG